MSKPFYKSQKENNVWNIEITSETASPFENDQNDTFNFYADEKLIARISDCEDAYEAIIKFGKELEDGNISLSDEIS